MKRTIGASRAALACAVLTLAPVAAGAETPTTAAPEESTPALEPTVPAAGTQDSGVKDEGPAGAEALILSEPVPTSKPKFALGNETYFVSPVLAIAGGVAAEHLIANPNANKESRATTAAITRFGFEGRLGPWVSFRSEFERNIRSHGSGVWEGTASFSVRDQFLRLERWGATVEAGIVLDPASVDFFSAHTADLLTADKYTRDPLLYSGFNRGQGVQARYSRWGFTLGLSYSEANPISSSATFMVGGSFAGGGRLCEKPLANVRNGQPDDEYHFRMLSPSLTYEHQLFEVKATAQLFDVNYQMSPRTDPPIRGYNLRASARLKLEGSAPIPFKMTPFVNAARVTNDVLNNTSGYDNQLLETPYDGLSLSGGIDLTLFDRSGIGVSYAQVRARVALVRASDVRLGGA